MPNQTKAPDVDYATRYVSFMKKLRGRNYEVRIPGTPSDRAPATGRFYGRSPVDSPQPRSVVPFKDPAPPAPDSYSSWTKKQLYERAKDYSIQGRSKMTKAELIVKLEAHDRKSAATACAPTTAEVREQRTSKSWLGEPLVRLTA